MAITEHKLFEHSLDFLNSIHAGYTSFARSDKTFDQYSAARCGKGGVGFIYRKSLDRNIEHLDCGNERIVGIKLSGYTVSHQPLFLFCVYMPADGPIDSYDQHIEQLTYIFNEYDMQGHVILCGDFNGSCVPNHNTNYYKTEKLMSFVNNTHLIPINACSTCRGPDFSFIPKNTMLDYILVD